ncbi:MAG: 1-phosphofructokinase family hexose kinase, partial [Sarcina sp.]
MIITVTLNPAIDKTIEIGSFEVNKVNRVLSSRMDVGGKGINVSKVIKSLGGESLATGFVGGNTGIFIKEYLNKINIENSFVESLEDTRTNVKIVDKVLGTNTDINETGADIDEEKLKK